MVEIMGFIGLSLLALIIFAAIMFIAVSLFEPRNFNN